MKTKIFSALAIAFCAALFSFTTKPGGEGFEIYLDNKLVLQQFGKDMSQVKAISIDPSHSKSQLSVKYYHCGQAGKNRTLVVKNGDNKVLKQWSFENTSKNDWAMKCGVKEILDLQKVSSNKLYLYYSSTDMSKERLLVTISRSDKDKRMAVK
jgi:hypothetical protein